MLGVKINATAAEIVANFEQIIANLESSDSALMVEIFDKACKIAARKAPFQERAMEMLRYLLRHDPRGQRQ